jgi:glycerophosphoryl diester phosphodiesterase
MAQTRRLLSSPHPARVEQRPIVYAHRGGSALRPENTFAAFDHGLALGADGLELDVHLSRDGVVVVHHDATLDRTTNGRGKISESTADELARVDAGFWFQPSEPLERTASGLDGLFRFRNQGHGVPRLRDVLTRYPGVPLIIELKMNTPELARRTIDEVRAANAIERVVLGSFAWRVLNAARQYEPRIATGASREEARWALYRSWVGWPLGRTAYREFQVPERSGATTIISPRFVSHAHRAGLAVKVWTVNEADDMRRLIGWGVNAIISDRPDLAAGITREASQNR